MTDKEKPVARQRDGLSEGVQFDAEHQQFSPPEEVAQARDRDAVEAAVSARTEHRSEAAAVDDTLTILRSKGLRMAKLWKADGTIEPYSQAKWFRVIQHDVDGIEALSALLATLEGDPHACLIRGTPNASVDPERDVRRLIDHFDDKPLHTLLIEIDDYRPLVSDPLDGKNAALDYLQECLPAPFQNASFHWQLSNSAGAPGKEGLLKLHLWMWLETPYDSATLRAWAKAENLKFDRSVLQVCQIHYVSAPMFEPGVLDPISARGLPRSGFWRGARHAVPLVINTAALRIKAHGVRQRGERLEGVEDPVADWLCDHWETWRTLANGGLVVSCPFGDGHSGGAQGDSSTVYFPAGTNGYGNGAWVCLHGHCSERAPGEFLQAVGYIDAQFAPLAATPPRSPPAQRQVVITASALRAVTFDPVVWVVDGLIPTGLTFFAGKPKVGKSWLMLDVALAVASGGYVLGRNCAEGDVLYCALEDNLRRLKSRMGRLCMFGDWPEGLTFRTEMRRLEEGGVEQLREWIASAENPRLIVVDVFSKVRRTKGAQEGLYDSDYAAVSPLKSLADETGVAIVVVHHLRKQAADDDPFDAVSGSTGLTGAADTTLILNRGSNGATLYGRGRDAEEIESAVEFDRSTCRWSLLGDAKEVRLSAERRQVLAALRAEAEPMTPSMLADVTGHPPSSTRRLLYSMAKAGEVAKAGRGKYTLP